MDDGGAQQQALDTCTSDNLRLDQAQSRQRPITNSHVHRAGHFRLSRIDSYEAAAMGMNHLLGEIAHRGDVRSGAEFNHDWPSGFGQPRFQALSLLIGLPRDPGSVTKHQDIWPKEAFA